MKTTVAVLALAVFSVASATAQKLTPMSHQQARQAWAQVDTSAPIVAPPVPTVVVTQTTTGLVMEKELNGQYPPAVIVIVTSNHNGTLLVRANTCSGDVIHLLSSTYYVDQGGSVSWQVLDTRAYRQALPTVDALCSVEAFQEGTYGLQRVAVANLQDISPTSFGVAGESFGIDALGAKKSYILTLSGIIPQGSRAILGRDQIAANVVNGVVTFPIVSGITGPTTLTLITPDGTASTVVYERKLTIGCSDPSAANYGKGTYPCEYVINQPN